MAAEQPTTPRPAIREIVIARPDAAVRDDRTLSTIAVAAGLVLVVGGLAKFVAHGWELDAFRRFGLPVPEVTVLVVGVAETAGGLLLAWRRLIAPTALIEVGIMAVAVAVSGIGHGDVIPSLTLAPLLLVGLVFLLVATLRPPRGGGRIEPGATA